MASSSGASSGEPTSDLATLFSMRKVDEEVLQLYAEKGLLDVPDKNGRTPLMFAYLKGFEDIVEFLSNGANPNYKCFRDGNTPMYYACMIEESVKDGVEEDLEDGSLSGKYCNLFKETPSIIAIIKLLLISGARIQDNLNGWSPPCVAAWHMMTVVVDFFSAILPLEENIKAIEILGVSQASLGRPYSFCENAFLSFSRAISLRQVATLPKVQTETSELAACFSKLSLHECHTTEEIKSIEQSEVGLKAHVFLVADRLHPKDLKQKCLYPSLMYFAFHSLLEENMWEEGLQVLCCAIGFESRGELKLGSVVGKLADMCRRCLDMNKYHQYLLCTRDLLCKCEYVLDHVEIRSLSDNSDTLFQSFSEILYHEANDGSSDEILSSIVQVIGKLVRVIRGRIRKENPDKYHKLSSVTFKVMELILAGLASRFPSINSRSRLRIRFVLLKMLFSDGTSHKDSYGDTLLHLMVYYSLSSYPSADCLEHLSDLVRAFVRHGCQIDVVNKNGRTARDVMLQIEPFVLGYVTDPILLGLMSPPTTALRLEEISIRQILRNDISYLGKLPTCLCEMIEGGVKDSDLVRDSDDSGINND